MDGIKQEAGIKTAVDTKDKSAEKAVRTKTVVELIMKKFQ